MNEVETRKDLRVRCKEIVKTDEKYFKIMGLLEKDRERVDMAGEFSDKDKGLDEGIQVVINTCEIVEGFGANLGNHADILNRPLQTNSVSNIEDASPEGWDLTRKDIKKL